VFWAYGLWGVEMWAMSSVLCAVRFGLVHGSGPSQRKLIISPSTIDFHMIDIIGLVEPRQVILVSVSAVMEVMGKKARKDNLITVDWHMPCSYKPFLYAISIGKLEFSHQMILKSGVFCVNFMAASSEAEIIKCGTVSGQVKDKFKETGLAKGYCEKIDCARVADPIGFLECELIDSIDSGDHTIFVGKVVNYHLAKKEKRLFHLDGRHFTTTEEY